MAMIDPDEINHCVGIDVEELGLKDGVGYINLGNGQVGKVVVDSAFEVFTSFSGSDFSSVGRFANVSFDVSEVDDNCVFYYIKRAFGVPPRVRKRLLKLEGRLYGGGDVLVYDPTNLVRLEDIHRTASRAAAKVEDRRFSPIGEFFKMTKTKSDWDRLSRRGE